MQCVYTFSPGHRGSGGRTALTTVRARCGDRPGVRRVHSCVSRTRLVTRVTVTRVTVTRETS
jgi:hypothetical protein